MPGTQLSLFDMNFTSNVVTKDKVLDKKAPSLDNKKFAMAKDITKEKTIGKIEKTKKLLELTTQQQKFLEQNRIMENENLSRIILKYSGGLVIELNRMNNFQSFYINTAGQKEFTLDKKSSVFPWDRIAYYKTDFEINTIQQQKLQEIKGEYQGKIKRIIHRNGDENILVEVPGKLLDVIANGWVLEFTETTHVDCNQDEVLEDFQKKQDIGKMVKVGDCVQATIGKSLVEGTIVSEYGMGCEILNIDFMRSGIMFRTAIGRKAVKAILRTT